jgi:hypothetical protein
MRFTEETKAAFKDEIVEWISVGKTLREFCRQEGSPGWVTVYKWIDEDADFRERFAHARDLGADAIAEQALEIADTPMIGQIITSKEWGEEIKEEDMLGHRKLQIETRLKLLAKWNPKKYGERVEQVHSGSIAHPDVNLTDAQKAALDRVIDGEV